MIRSCATRPSRPRAPNLPNRITKEKARVKERAREKSPEMTKLTMKMMKLMMRNARSIITSRPRVKAKERVEVSSLLLVRYCSL